MERFHGTLRPDFFDVTGPFPSIETAQSAVDAWVADYNDERPHQALDPQWPVTPAERFAAIPAEQRELLPLWLPSTIAPAHLVDIWPHLAGLIWPHPTLGPVMSQQSVRQAARRSTLEAQLARRRVRAERERRLEGLTMDVLVAVSERDAAIQAAECRAGQALRVMMDREGLSLREVVECCVGEITLREATRMRRLVSDP